MRDFKGMKRQRGRNRNGGGQGGGGKPQHNANRAFESNGPDNVKIRGNAQHVFEKYQQLARDASSSGDRVLAENYLQHAEHYFRVIRAVTPSKPTAEIIGRDTFTSGYDIDFEDESGDQVDPDGAEAGEGEDIRADRQPRDNGPQNPPRDRPFNRDDRARDDRPRDDRPRDDRPRDDRPRDERPRDERPRDGGQPRERGFARDERPRDRDRNRDDRPRDDRPRDDRPREDRPREDRVRDPLAVVEPQSSPLFTAPEDSSPALAPRPRRAGVPRSEGVLRSEDGDVSHAPAFLQAREAPAPAAAEADDEAKPKPRRRRAPRSFDAAETAGSDEG